MNKLARKDQISPPDFQSGHNLTDMFNNFIICEVSGIIKRRVGVLIQWSFGVRNKHK